MKIDKIRKFAPENATLYAWFCGTYCYFYKVGHTVYWCNGTPFTFASVTKLKPL